MDVISAAVPSDKRRNMFDGCLAGTLNKKDFPPGCGFPFWRVQMKIYTGYCGKPCNEVDAEGVSCGVRLVHLYC